MSLRLEDVEVIVRPARALVYEDRGATGDEGKRDRDYKLSPWENLEITRNWTFPCDSSPFY